MLEVARLLAFLAAILLLVSGAAWIKLFRGPELYRLRVSGATAGKAEIASRLLITAAALSAVAASLAVIARLFP